MKIKNLSPIELHVEKGVLALAVLAGGYLAYASFTEHTMVDCGGERVLPAEVEGKIRKAILLLREKQAETNNRIPTSATKDLTNMLVPESKDNAKDYDEMLRHPLPETLLTSSGIPAFGPANYSMSGAGTPTQPDGGDKGDWKMAMGEIPLRLDKAEAVWCAGGRVTSGAEKTPRDARVIMARCTYPMKELRAAIGAGDGKHAALGGEYQTVLIANVEWLRQERAPGGSWSTDWQAVPALQAPVKLGPAPAAGGAAPAAGFKETPIEQLVEKLKSPDTRSGVEAGQAGWIVKYLMLKMGSTLQPALPTGFYDREANDPLFTPYAAATTSAPATMAVVMGASMVLGGARLAPEKQTEGELPKPATGEVSYEAVTKMDNVPIWRYDDALEPGHEYRYKVRLTIYNPLYRFATGNLDMVLKPELATVPFFYTNWVETNVVRVPATSLFFVERVGVGVVGGAGVSGQVQVSGFIYKYQLGKWYSARQINMNVGSVIGAGQLGVNFFPGVKAPMNFDTGYTIVDVNPATANGEGTVVLMTPGGQLITRATKDDLPDNASFVTENQKNIVKETATTTAASRPGVP